MFYNDVFIFTTKIILLIFFIIIIWRFFIFKFIIYSAKEIERHVEKQINCDIDDFFKYSKTITPTLKKIYANEKPLIHKDGEEIEVDIPLKYGPGCIAYWLKQKHHQWFIVLYAHSQKNKSNFTRMYGNKGEDKFDVVNLLENRILLGKGKRLFYDTILVFHNHPESEGVQRSVSSKDIERAKKRQKLAQELDWNYQEFLCIAGEFSRPFMTHYNLTFRDPVKLASYRAQYEEINKRGALAILKSRWLKK